MQRSSLLPILRLALCACVGTLLSGCGSEPATSTNTGIPPQAVAITVQPASVTVPQGLSATFSVIATGSDPLHYQWTENGQPISGATASAYTASNVAFGDDGTKFAVIVSNSVNSVTSAAAVLTVGARSPAAGDLRFQQVDSPTQSDQGMFSSSIWFMDINYNFAPNSTGSPLQLSNVGCVAGIAHDCGWGIFTRPLPTAITGLTYAWSGGSYSSLASDLVGPTSPTSMASANSVITSLDLQPANDAYAVTWQTIAANTAFVLNREVVAPGAVASAVAADGAASRVVTAVSFDDSTGQVDLLSYGWLADTTTPYDTDLRLAGPTMPEIESAATALAEGGYILTAFGGNFTDGFLLIGTKVHGDTMPRPILLFDQDSPAPAAGALAGYALLGTALDGSGQTQYVFIYEK